MLKIIKKDGKVVKFERDKIKISIGNVASDINFIINQKEIDIIAKEIEEKIIKVRGENGITSSLEVISLILDSLHCIGYVKLADAYYKGSFKITAK